MMTNIVHEISETFTFKLIEKGILSVIPWKIDFLNTLLLLSIKTLEILEVQFTAQQLSNSKVKTSYFVDIPKPQTTPTTPKGDTSSEMQVKYFLPKIRLECQLARWLYPVTAEATFGQSKVELFEYMSFVLFPLDLLYLLI